MMLGSGGSLGNGESIKAALDCDDDPRRDPGMYVHALGGAASRLLQAAVFRL